MPWLASRPIVPFMLTYNKKIRTPLSPNGASIIMPTLFRPLPDRPSLNSFVMSPPKASMFAPSKQASCHPHTAMFLKSLARLGLHHTPPGPLSANALSLDPGPPVTFSQPPVDFQKPRFDMDYYARAGGHKRCHQEHKGSQRSGTGCPQCLQPNAVHPPPTLLGIPVRDDGSATLIQPTLMAPPRVGDSLLPHHPPPLQCPSRPTTLARSQSWHNLRQSSSMFTPPQLTLPITKSHDGVQFLRDRTRQPHFLRMATPLPTETSLAKPARHHVAVRLLFC